MTKPSKVYIIVLISQLLIVSCQRTQKMAENQILTFDLSEVPKITNIALSDLGFVDIEYIPLETNELNLISGIDNIYFNDYNINKIIVGDGYYLIKNGERIFKFNDNGSFITTIGTVGRGPDEINNIGDLVIDKERQEISILSGWQKKIFVYSENGQFLRTLNIPFYIHEFSLFEGRIIGYCGRNSGKNVNSFVVMETNGQIVAEFRNRYLFDQKSGYGFTHENLFYGFNDKLYVKEIFSDTIYSIEEMKFRPHLILNAGDRLITPEARSNYDMFYIAENYLQPMNLLEFGDYLYYGSIYKLVFPDALLYGFIGSKKKDFQAFFDLNQGIVNDLDGGPNIVPITTKNDHTIITLLDALKLKSHVSSDVFRNSVPKYPEKKKALEKLAVSLKETDNPVLILVKLKK